MNLKTSGQTYKKYFFLLIFCGAVFYFFTVIIRISMYDDIKKAPITPGYLITVKNGTSRSQGRYCKKTLPKLIIVGFSKCGTAALTLFLSYHPNVTIDHDLRKEIKFFNLNYELGFDWYLQELPCTTRGKIVVDRSSDYVYEAEVPKRIWGMSAQTKIVIVVCEPIRRLISEFRMKVRMGLFKNISIEDYLLDKTNAKLKLNTTWYPIEQSHYSFHFNRWLHTFPLEQMHVVDGERLQSDPWNEMTLLEKFLHVNHFYQKKYFEFNEIKGFFCFNANRSKQSKCLGKTKGLKHPDIDTKVKTLLQEYYKPYNEEFYILSQRRFKWWNKTLVQGTI